MSRGAESGLFAVTLVLGSGLLFGPYASAQVAARKETPRLPAPGMKLRLESITPSDGALIGPYTVLRASLSYAIADFEPDTFRIITQFDTDTLEEGMTSGDHAGDCKLVKPSGRCEVRFPVLAVWNEPEISRPFKVWFYLTRRNERRTSTVVAFAGPVRYRAK